MAKRGRTPSLIGGGAGASKFVQAGRKRSCKRCRGAISMGGNCIEVAIPGSLGHRTYCPECYAEILVQSRKDLEQLEITVRGLA